MNESVQDLRTMPEARVRAWFEGLPKEELVEMLVSHVLVYQRDRTDEGSEGSALGDLLDLTFAQLLDRLKDLTSHPELSRFRVDGERVVYVTETGTEVPINATGERDTSPSLVRQTAPMAPPAPAERPPDAHVIDPPRPRPASGGPLFSGGGAAERSGGLRPIPVPRSSPPAGPVSPTGSGQMKTSSASTKKGPGGGKKGSLLEF